MAFQCSENLDDGELWLPSDFLSDESPPKERVATNSNKTQFPREFSYEWSLNGVPLDSSYNSPVESIVGSTETESDEEDDHMAGLAQRIAHSMLEDDENTGTKQLLQWASGHKSFLSRDTSKSNTMARSPQSTLSGVGSWSTCSLGSGNSTGNSKGPSQVSSPPTTPMAKHTDAWDLLYAAAGEVVRLNMNGVNAIAPPPGRQMHGQGCFPIAARQSSSSQTPTFLAKDLQTRSCSFSGFPSKDRVNTFQAFRRSWTDKTREEDKKIPSHHQYRQLRQNHVSGWGKQAKPVQAQFTQARGGNKSGVGNRSFRPVEYSSPPWPPVQQAAGSGMRAVFLGSSGSGRESGGTGVFLPRRMGSNSNLRKKPACSTVLLPSRIVEALNLNVEDISSQPNLQCSISHVHRDILESMPAASSPATVHYGGRPNDHYNYKSVVRNGLSEQQKKPCNPVRPQIQAASSEICLPQEWTY